MMATQEVPSTLPRQTVIPVPVDDPLRADLRPTTRLFRTRNPLTGQNILLYNPIDHDLTPAADTE